MRGGFESERAAVFTGICKWRLIAPPKVADLLWDIKYREGASFLVPYLTFNVPKTDGPYLWQVIAGPTPRPADSLHSLEGYLHDRKAKPLLGVAYCDIPYRDW
jgi:hypothetical protein